MPKTGGDKIDEGGTAEDSESSSDDSSSEEESDWEECDDEFCFLGTPVSTSPAQQHRFLAGKATQIRSHSLKIRGAVVQPPSCAEAGTMYRSSLLPAWKQMSGRSAC